MSRKSTFEEHDSIGLNGKKHKRLETNKTITLFSALNSWNYYYEVSFFHSDQHKARRIGIRLKRKLCSLSNLSKYCSTKTIKASGTHKERNSNEKRIGRKFNILNFKWHSQWTNYSLSLHENPQFNRFISFHFHCRNNLWIADSFNVISSKWLIKVTNDGV